MGISASFAASAQKLINIATGQVGPIPISGSTFTVTAAQANFPILSLTGNLSTSCLVTLPNQGSWLLINQTTGGQTVVLTNGAGATLVLSPSLATSTLSIPGTGILPVGSAAVGVASFNARTGNITLVGSDITGAGGALLTSPTFTGVPVAPTATGGTNTTQIATTAFVASAVTAGVTGFAPLASPALTGAPTAPTTSNADNSTHLATTAFVQNILSAVTGGLNYQGTWNATTNSPTLVSSTGTKGFLYQVSVAGTTTLDGNSTWNVGDFVNFNGSVWQRIPAQSTGVASFNTRTGAVTLTSLDVTNALGFTPANATSIAGLAPLASPALTGTPTGPTATAGTNTTQLATTAFVVASYAPLASPNLTGTPTAPTATLGTNTTQIATTAYVLNAMGSFAPLVSPAFTGTPTVPTATAGTNNTQAASTAFVATSYAPKASPILTGRTQSDAYSFTTIALGNISGGTTLNMAAATEWSATLIGATSFTFTNTLGANTSEVILLRLTNGGAFTITWPSNTQFTAKTAPVLTSAGVDLLGVKYDQVTSTYMVFVVGLNIG